MTTTNKEIFLNKVTNKFNFLIIIKIQVLRFSYLVLGYPKLALCKWVCEQKQTCLIFLDHQYMYKFAKINRKCQFIQLCNKINSLQHRNNNTQCSFWIVTKLLV